jgi:hypothetical protein
MTRLEQLACTIGFLALALICDMGAIHWCAERPAFAAHLLLLAVLFAVLGLGFFWKLLAKPRRA